MSRFLALVLTLTSGVAFAAAPSQTASSTSEATVTTKEAQDSANGSMTNTDLTGNIHDDTSALSKESVSGTTSGAIIDHTDGAQPTKSKSKSKKHKKKMSTDTTDGGHL